MDKFSSVVDIMQMELGGNFLNSLTDKKDTVSLRRDA